MIYDPLRRKYLPETPEELVRQKLIRWLHEKKGIPYGLMASEYSFQYNGLTYRADIVAFNRELKPVLLVECKAPDVALDDEVFEQALRYNRVLDVDKIMLCNGKEMRCWEKPQDGIGTKP